jgi:glycosyltransferase involved in cell wall biosynthesis
MRRAGEAPITVIVTTIGRPRLLDRLLGSLAAQTLRPAEIVVADQSTDGEVAAVIERWRRELPVVRVASPRGASAGRNAALAARSDRHQPAGYLAFPDDDTVYPPDTLARAVKALEGGGADVISGRLVTLGGDAAQLAFGDTAARIDDRSVWTKALTETCFFRAAFIEEIGGFDEELGIGCRTPWQSGAETDLLLRGLRAGRTIAYDPDLVVSEDNPADPAPSDPAYRAKARHAARGTGRVYRRHYGAARCAAVVGKPLAAALVRALQGRRAEAAWFLQKAIGRLEGLTGLLLPAPPTVDAQRPTT